MGASQTFKFVVRASCPRLISREQDAPTTAYFFKIGMLPPRLISKKQKESPPYT